MKKISKQSPDINKKDASSKKTKNIKVTAKLKETPVENLDLQKQENSNEKSVEQIVTADENTSVIENKIADNENNNKIKSIPSKRRTRKKKHLSLADTAKLVIIIAGIVLISILTSKVLHTFGVFVASNRQILTKTQEVSVTSIGTLCYEQYGKGVIVANSGTITMYDSDFEQEWEIEGYDGSPVIETNGKYALVAYRDSSNAKLINNSDIIPINAPGKIITSAINKNGYFALVVNEVGYKSQVCVYDNEGNAFYKWHSADNKITDVSISPDNKSMAISYIPFNGDGTECGIMIFDFTKSNPVAGYKQNDNFIMNIEYVAKNRIVSVGDSYTTFYKTNGKIVNHVNYPDKQFVTFEVTDKGKTILCFSDDDSLMSNSVIFSYNSNGRQTDDFECEGRVISVKSCDNKLLVAGNGKFDLLTDKLKRVRDTATFRNLENSVLFNGGKYSFVVNGNMAQVIKIN